MLKAGALLYVIFICLIMTIFAGLLMTLNYYKSIEISDYATIEKLNRNVRSGLNYLLVNPDLYQQDSMFVDLFDSGFDSVLLKSNTYGFYRKLTALAKEKRFKTAQSILAGVWNNSIPALYLENATSTLGLAGSSSINGKCFLPSQNVTYPYIENHKFTGKELSKENISLSDNSKSFIDKKYFELVFNQISKITKSNNLFDWDLYADSLTISNDFEKPTINIFSSKNLVLNQKKIEGNIQIISSKSILVKANSIIRDVILIAPRIEFEKSFRGTLQCLAFDSVIVGENTVLEYPSIISVIRKNKTKDNAYIELSRGDSIFGSIILYDQNENPNKFNLISVMGNSFVYGHVYSSGYTQINGCIFGGIHTNKLTLRTISSIYDNLLLDCHIDASQISPFYLNGCNQIGNKLKTLKYLK